MKHRTIPLRLAMLAALAVAGWFAFSAGPSAPALAATNCTVSSAAIDSVEQEMLALINQHRANNGKAALQFSSTLNAASAWKSQHMADLSYFAHDDTPINRTWVQRIRDCGYTYNTWIGENIAAGNETASATFDQWRNSSGHNANMLNANYTVIGIGRAYNANSPHRWYWTTDFGGYSDGYTAGPAATPTPTRTPTAVPPPASAPGVRVPGTAPDADHDGCTNSRELGADPVFGGQRNPNNYWDFFDVPDGTNRYDGTVDLSVDIFGILFRFGSTDNAGQAAVNRNTNPLSMPPATGYHPAFDRSAPAPGAPLWQLGPPDGEIDLFVDVFGAANQFGHTCM